MISGSIQSDLPGQRLAELFNVNHFIVSQVNPHINPLMNLYEPLGKAVNFIGTEVALALPLHSLTQHGSLSIACTS